VHLDPAMKWVLTIRSASVDPKIQVICFPHAGGSPDMFRAWADCFADNVDLIAVRLPGRGSRIREKPYDRWEPLVTDTFAALAPRLSEPHVLYGHSFGGRLAYELAHLIQAEYPARTQRLFISACRSPNTMLSRPYLHELPEQDFLAAIKSMGGTPAEILDSDLMRPLLVPIMYNEIRLTELSNQPDGRRIDVPITAIYGRDDVFVTPANMKGWRGCSLRESELLTMPGDHFFLETHRTQLLDIINSRLEGAKCPSS